MERFDMTGILDRFFHARNLAIIGASSDPDKLGGKPLRQCLDLGFAGRIYPVNPNASEIQGIPAVASIAALPDEIDCAVIALPAAAVEKAVEACAAKRIPLAIILSGGFAEASEKGRETQARILGLARAGGMRLVGPNSMGGVSFENRISATFTAIDSHEGKSWPPLGSISIASQSGFVGSHLMAMFRDRGLGVAKWLATGNQADIDLADCIENFAMDDITKTIVVYVEGAGRPQDLRRAFDLARTRGKPVVALRAGRSEMGARAVASHTASLVGDGAAFSAVLRRHGVYEAASIDELIDVVAALDTGRSPRDARLGVATASGGFGILISDAAAQHGLELPALSEAGQKFIRDKYPLATTRNPVDVNLFAPIGDAMRVLRDDDYGALVVALGHFGLLPGRVDSMRVWINEIRATRPDLFIAIVASLGERQRREFQQLGVFACEDPARAVAALAAARWLRAPRDQAPDDLPVLGAIDPALIAAAGDETGARALVRAIGIPVVDEVLATSAEAAVAAAKRFAAPVAMKIASPDIWHKSDIGGVALGVSGDAEVEAAFATILANACDKAPDARIFGVLVSPMVEGGVETILGMTHDPVFGPVVMFGLGGVYVEVLRDHATDVAPVGPRAARRMIESIAGYPLLAGARGRPAVDLAALADAIARLSAFAVAHVDRIDNIEINPLLATPKGVLALDALAFDTRKLGAPGAIRHDP